MEYKEVNLSEILNCLHKLIYLTSGEIQIDAIIVVGSNHNISSKKKIPKNSDIDFVILNQSKTFAVKEKFQGITYDIAFVNHNDMGTVVLGALSGSPFFGKFFSSITKYNIIKDKDDLGVKFVNIVTYLYRSFKESFIPNYEISTISLESIAANKEDLEKNTIEETNFAFIRLSEHVFNYISYLAYPIHTSGSYRGKVIEKKFQYIENRENNDCILGKKDLIKITEYIAPTSEYNFFGFIDDENIQEAISNNKIENYYYGFDNLVTEESIVFLSEEDVLKNNFKLHYIKNIIPFLTKEQLGVCTDLFIFLSMKHQKTTLENRIQLLLNILNSFRKEKIHEVIVRTLKSLIIIKSIHLLAEAEKIINIDALDEWLLQTKEDLYFPKTSSTDVDLKEIFNIITKSRTDKYGYTESQRDTRTDRQSSSQPVRQPDK